MTVSTAKPSDPLLPAVAERPGGRLGRGNDEPAALGHGVAGVDHEVREHLLQLAGVGLHPQRPGVEGGRKLDVFADQPVQHRVEVADQAVEVEHDRLPHLFAAERQQLAGQGGGAFSGLLDLTAHLTHVVVGAVAAHEVGVAENDRKQIVKVVSDAAGQPAQGLQLLRLVDGFLGRPSRLGRALPARQRPRQQQGPLRRPVAAQRRGRQFDGDVAARRRQQTRLHGRRGLALAELLQ